MKIALIGTLALTLLIAGGIAVAQQPATTPALPAIDEASLAALQPIVAQRTQLLTQLNMVQAQFRVAQQQALAVAKLDPAYYGVDSTGTKFVQMRRPPALAASPAQ